MMGQIFLINKKYKLSLLHNLHIYIYIYIHILFVYSVTTNINSSFTARYLWQTFSVKINYQLLMVCKLTISALNSYINQSKKTSKVSYIRHQAISVYCKRSSEAMLDDAKM